ncbi:MAG: hypothetical protein KC964_22605, partial [Candidatus Omnitrophica bacterium]|nr:hypothetical protein [Candidatus Omnitrophota bacterium]
MNFSFLTSYYMLFTCSDLVYRWRVFERGLDRYTKIQRQAARLVGPAALVLYASLATLFFEHTKIYWDRIHFYWFPLAALQVGLAYFHREKRNADYPLYGVAATVFFTLGLASWLGGFSLNLALAAEALMLLVLAKRLRLWFLNPLAQIVLIINFLHFWNSDARDIDTWPIFIGSVATALVYFVKSRIEETWEKGVRDETVTESVYIAALRETFDDLVKPLSYVHAFGGAVLLFYQCGQFFDREYGPLPVSIFASSLIFASLILRSTVLVPAVWFLGLGLIVRMFQVEPIQFEMAPRVEPLSNPKAAWFLSVLSSTIFALASCLALFASRWLRSRLFLVLGFGGLVLTALAFMVGLDAGTPISWLFILPLITPAILWIETDRSSESCGGGGVLEIRNPIEKISRFLPPLAVQISFSVLAGLATISTAESAIESPKLQILLLTIVQISVLVAALKCDSPTLGVGLFILSFWVMTNDIFSKFDLDKMDPHWILWAAFVTLVVAIAAFAGGMARGRSSFAWLGIAVLALLHRTFVEIVLHGTGGILHVSNYIFWILLIFAMWLAIEVFRETFSSTDPESYSSWSDTLWIKALLPAALFIAVAFSLGASFLLYRYSVAFFDHKTNAAWAVGIYSVPLFLLAGVIRSYTLGVGAAATLTLAHGCVYFFNGGSYVGEHHPVLMAFLVALPLLAGGALEFTTWRDTRNPTKNSFLASVGASVYLYAIALLLGRFLVEGQAAHYFVWPHASFPFHITLALIVLLAGWRLKNSWMEISGLVYASFASLGFVAEVLDPMKPQPAVFLTALIMAGQIIVMERIVHRQPKMILNRIGEGLANWVHGGLVPLAAILLII